MTQAVFFKPGGRVTYMFEKYDVIRYVLRCVEMRGSTKHVSTAQAAPGRSDQERSTRSMDATLGEGSPQGL